MIHYNGTFQPSPGIRVACRAVSPQATTQSWHATDCTDCKKTLIGMSIRWKFAEWVTARIAAVARNRATVVIQEVDRGPRGEENPSLFELETKWEPNR